MCETSYKRAREDRTQLATHKNMFNCFIFICDICGWVLSTDTVYLNHLESVFTLY